MKAEVVAYPGRQLELAGAVALLLGVGFGRYLFTPLITPMVEQGWFSDRQTAVLGALNLLGYMLGALTANAGARACGQRRVIGLALIVLVASLTACMLDAGLIWYGGWRLVAGWAAATLTIVVTPAIMARVPLRRRPSASAIIFTGIGAGTMGSGLLVPPLAHVSIALVWAIVALVAALLGLWSWRAVWRHLDATTPASAAAFPADGGGAGLAVVLIIAAYGLTSAGFVPHSLFWVDYIARELGRGLATGSAYWTVFGLGSVIGPAGAGLVAARLGFLPALILAYALMTTAIGLPLLSSSMPALGASSFLVGALVPAIITLTAGAVVEMAPAHRRQSIWGRATLAFAAAQAAGGFLMSRLYAALGSYLDLFGVGTSLLAVGLLCVVAAACFRKIA